MNGRKATSCAALIVLQLSNDRSAVILYDRDQKPQTDVCVALCVISDVMMYNSYNGINGFPCIHLFTEEFQCLDLVTALYHLQNLPLVSASAPQSTCAEILGETDTSQ